jgi:phosphatidylserine synthase
MFQLSRFPKNIAAVLTFGRPPLAFGAFACALWLIFTLNPFAYILGVTCLLLATAFDWVDGWFAGRYAPESKLGPLVDRMMDRVVYSIIFPVLGAGMFWRLFRLQGVAAEIRREELFHAIFVLAICVLVLMRDQFAHFLRSFGDALAHPGESYGLTRLRAMVATPVATVLYAYAFYLPTDGWAPFYRALNWLDQLPLRMLYVLELMFLLINTVSVTLHLRRYGRLALDDICEDDEVLRRRILAVFPNALTLMNGLLGIVAMVFVSNGRVREALFLLLGAAFFDKLDGSVARRLGLTEPPPDAARPGSVRLGALLDDLSDAISFCIAPAAIYIMVMNGLGMEATGIPVWTVGSIYAISGIARLIYFTLDKSPIPGFFKGMPTPAAAMLAVPAVEIVHQLDRTGSEWVDQWALVTTGVMLLSSVVMNIYPIRYLHFGRWVGRHPVLMWTTIALAFILVFTPYFGMTLFGCGILYLFSPLTTGHIDPAEAEAEVPQHRQA